jgi:hypothetical protein
MLSEQEFQALVSVMQRAPMLPAEVLAIQAIVEKLKPKPPEAQA